VIRLTIVFRPAPRLPGNWSLQSCALRGKGDSADRQLAWAATLMKPDADPGQLAPCLSGSGPHGRPDIFKRGILCESWWHHPACIADLLTAGVITRRGVLLGLYGLFPALAGKVVPYVQPRAEVLAANGSPCWWWSRSCFAPVFRRRGHWALEKRLRSLDLLPGTAKKPKPNAKTTRTFAPLA